MNREVSGVLELCRGRWLRVVLEGQSLGGATMALPLGLEGVLSYTHARQCLEISFLGEPFPS